MEKVKRKTGISLIVLVITILVMIILAGVVIVNMSENNPIGKAKEARFKEDLTAIGEELNMFTANKAAENSSFLLSSLNANSKIVLYNTKGSSKENTIADILPSLKSSKYKNQIEIIAGTLFYKSPDKKEIAWLKDMGIHYTGIVTGTVNIEGDTLIGVSNDYVNTGTLVVPSNVKKIAPGAFAGCEDIHAIVFQGENITEIPANCFRGCKNLAAVTLPESVTTIGAFAFDQCRALKEIKLPRDLVTVGYSAFSHCSSMTKVVCNEKLTTLEDYSFIHCGELAEFVFPQTSLTHIKTQVFQGSKLVNVVIPDSVTYIGRGAYLQCMSLNSLKVGKGVKDLLGSIVRQCDKVTSLTVDPENPYYVAEGNVIYNHNKTEIVSVAANISSITIPSTVTEIAPELFLGCHNLTSITIPEGVTTIGERAFAYCKNLTSLTLPKSLSNLGIRAIEENTKLTNIAIHPENPYYVHENGVIFDKNKTRLITAADVNAEYTVPETVTVIDSCAFYQAKNLKKITLPSKLKVIGDDAFSACGISEITIPGSVTEIGVNMFRHTTSLQKIVISEGVKTIPKFLVPEVPTCTVEIPSTVTLIRPSVFALSGKNITVKFPKGNSNYKLNGNYITSTDGKTLVCGFSLPDIAVIPEGVETLNEEIFREMNGAKEYIFPSSLKSIPSRVFSYNSVVTKVVVQGNVTNIHDAAFKDANNLSQIIIKKKKGSIVGAPWGAPQGEKAVIWQ